MTKSSNVRRDWLTDGYYSLVVCPRPRRLWRNAPESLVELTDGSLLLVYAQKIGRMDEDAELTMGKKSHDDGRTWGRSFQIFANDARMHSGTCGWLRLKSGRLGVAFYRMDNWDDMKIWYLESADEGKTFSEPVLITTRPGYNCPCDRRLVQLDSGRLLYPVAYTARSRAENENYSVLVYLSDDEGRTWHEARTELKGARRGLMEPVIAEIKDGRCMMLIRTQLGSQYQSFSDDGGETWIDAQPSALVSPEAGAFLTTIPSTGDLLACWNYDFKPHWPRRHYGLRCPLTVAISKDGGRTWGNVKDIEDDHHYGYSNPAITFHRGLVYITYARCHLISQWGIMDSKLTIVPEEFFYNDRVLDRALRETPMPARSGKKR